MEQRISPSRCMASTKPRKTRPDVQFFRCGKCGCVLTGWPCALCTGEHSCCGAPMQRLEPVPVETGGLGLDYKLDYEIVGSLNENAVRVTWGGKRPAWIYLETFRGGQYIEIGKKDRRAVFALAGDDAYAYCDKDPCEQCSFRCKNGFALYAYWEDAGLAVLPLNRIAATSGPAVSRTKMRSQNQ